jgi:hypothetical protein
VVGVGPVTQDPRRARRHSDFARQHGSHRHLLDEFNVADVKPKPGAVDAIVVPTARPVKALHHVIGLAAESGCALLVLCSKKSVAAKAVQLARRAGVECVVVDVARAGSMVLPSFETDEIIADLGFGNASDLSFKRNLGLLFALAAGWRRIVFLDDDITVPEPDHLLRAAGLLGSGGYRAVGLKVGGFPDNSVVCHANRMTGGFQETYIGGGALAVDVRKVKSFFPGIYNEDWFFLLSCRPAVVGRVEQAAYDPFLSRGRATMEEFGDCLAEGLYALLDTGRSVADATEGYWAEFVRTRCQLIVRIRERVLKSDKSDLEKDPIVDALFAAEDRCRAIEPRHCVDYLKAWRADRERWGQFVACLRDAVQGRAAPAAAIRQLKIGECATYLPAVRDDEVPSRPPAVGRRLARLASGLLALLLER